MVRPPFVPRGLSKQNGRTAASATLPSLHFHHDVIPIGRSMLDKTSSSTLRPRRHLYRRLTHVSGNQDELARGSWPRRLLRCARGTCAYVYIPIYFLAVVWRVVIIFLLCIYTYILAPAVCHDDRRSISSGGTCLITRVADCCRGSRKSAVASDEVIRTIRYFMLIYIKSVFSVVCFQFLLLSVEH